MEYVLLPAFISLYVTYSGSITMREDKSLERSARSVRVVLHY
jgi:hypothetical protein